MTITDIQNQKVALLRDDIISRLDSAVFNLLVLRDTTLGGDDSYARLDAKADAIQAIRYEDGERLTNVQTEEDVVTLAALIKTKHDAPEAQAGVQLVVDYMLGYIR
jgi:hypothetical protein